MKTPLSASTQPERPQDVPKAFLLEWPAPNQPIERDHVRHHLAQLLEAASNWQEYAVFLEGRVRREDISRQHWEEEHEERLRELQALRNLLQENREELRKMDERRRRAVKAQHRIAAERAQQDHPPPDVSIHGWRQANGELSVDVLAPVKEDLVDALLHVLEELIRGDREGS